MTPHFPTAYATVVLYGAPLAVLGAVLLNLYNDEGLWRDFGALSSLIRRRS